MGSEMTKDVLSAASPENKNETYLKFRLFFGEMDFLTNFHSEPYKKKFFYYYENYKKLIKDKGDVINLENNSFDCYLYHVKNIILELFSHKLIVLDGFEKDFKEQTPEFKFQYFKSLSTCFENFRKFVIFLNCLKLDKEEPIDMPENNLIENNECPDKQESSSESDSFTILENGSFDSDSSSIEEDSTKSNLELKTEDEPNLISEENLAINTYNVLKISYFKEFLQKKFDGDFKNKKDTDKRIDKLYDEIVYMFDVLSYEILLQLSLNEIILPIKGIFTLEACLDKFYDLIKNEIDIMLEFFFELTMNGISKSDIIFRFKPKFKKKLVKMQKSIIYDAWESANIREYFSVLLGREIKNEEDMMDVNKIICDYRNMMTCELFNKMNMENSSGPYFIYPKFNDNLKCRLVRGIEIMFNHPIRYGGFQIYDSAGESFSDGTITCLVLKCKDHDAILFWVKRLREEKIHEIEVKSKDVAIKKRFPISKYLDA